MNKYTPSANPEYVAAMQGLRRSSAASKHRNKSKYDRKRDNRVWKKEV